MIRAKVLGNNRGFTLIELMVVVVIVGVLAAVTVPQFVKQAEKAKINAAMADITTIKTTIDLYISENGEVPTASNDDSTGSIATVLSDAGISWNSLTDPWDVNYKYEVNSAGEYQISSAGSDRILNGSDSISSDDDIIATESSSPKNGEAYAELVGAGEVESNSP